MTPRIRASEALITKTHSNFLEAMNSTLNENRAVSCVFLEGTPNSSYMVTVLCITLHSLSFLPATFGNAIIICAIWRTHSLQSPSNVLLGCLALADFTTGIFAQPLTIASLVAQLQGNGRLFCSIDAARECVCWISSGVSVTLLSVISADRFLAVYLHLRYRAVVTVQRVLALVASFWVLGVIFSILRFTVISGRVFVIAQLPFMFSFLLIVPLANVRILKLVRRHQKQIQNQVCEIAQTPEHEQATLEINRTKKATMTIVYVVSLFWFCFAPFACTCAIYVVYGWTPGVKTAYELSTALTLSNAALNPFVYCSRLRELREAVLLVIKQVSFRA